MEWFYFVRDELDSNGGQITCTVCGKSITNGDFVYSPQNFTDEQWEWMKRIWNVYDPIELQVCESCIEGHCGSVEGLTPDMWLDKKIKEFKEEKGGRK